MLTTTQSIPEISGTPPPAGTHAPPVKLPIYRSIAFIGLILYPPSLENRFSRQKTSNEVDDEPGAEDHYQSHDRRSDSTPRLLDRNFISARAHILNSPQSEEN